MIEAVPRAKQHTVYKTRDGKRVPGATTILGVIAKPALVRWANNLGLQGIDSTKYVDALADIGTLAHAMILEDLGGEPVNRNEWSSQQLDRAENCALKWLGLGLRIEPIAIEKPLVSELYGYGGTTDLVGTVDGVLEIVDIKTSKAIYDDHIYQAAAYRQLAIENGYDVPKRVRVVQVGRSDDEGDVSQRIATGDELDRYWGVFLAALHLYNAQKAARRKS